MAEDEKTKGNDHGKRFASWTFHEYEQHQRGKWWYIIAATIIIAILVYSIYDQNYMFTVIIALATFIYIYLMQRQPKLVTFSITEDGVEVHEAFYPYKDFKQFWLIYEPPTVKKLYLEFKNGVRPMLSIPLESQNPLTIRDILLQYLKEDLERDNESFSDALQRTLKL
jgi:hypothetical protein